MFETIRSVQNTRIKHLVRLRDGSHRRRQKRFLIEGAREFERAMKKGWPVESLYFCEDLFNDEAASYALLDSAEDASIEIFKLAEEPFRKCAYRQGPDGILAVGIQQDRSPEQLKLSDNPLLVVLESVEKPGNLGAIMRTANAAGADAILLAQPRTDPYNPNAIRSSQGAFFEIPFTSSDNQTVRNFLSQNGYQVVATSPDAKQNLWDADLRGPTALVFGAEDTGLSADWLVEDQSFKLPMQGITDSLNVASAAAVCLFEAVRQRQS